MLEYRKILDGTSAGFVAVWDLYCTAFPREERRGMAQQLSVMEHKDYTCEAVFDTTKGCFVGFVMWWSVAGVLYIEHLATVAELRGGGYGRRVLQEFVQRQGGGTVLLEVEYPDEPIKARRIGFYERCGFVLNSHRYSHPPYGAPEDDFLELLVMTHPLGITHEELERFKTVAFPIVHQNYYRTLQK